MFILHPDRNIQTILLKVHLIQSYAFSFISNHQNSAPEAVTVLSAQSVILNDCCSKAILQYTASRLRLVQICAHLSCGERLAIQGYLMIVHKMSTHFKSHHLNKIQVMRK